MDNNYIKTYICNIKNILTKSINLSKSIKIWLQVYFYIIILGNNN